MDKAEATAGRKQACILFTGGLVIILLVSSLARLSFACHAALTSCISCPPGWWQGGQGAPGRPWCWDNQPGPQQAGLQVQGCNTGQGRRGRCTIMAKVSGAWQHMSTTVLGQPGRPQCRVVNPHIAVQCRPQNMPCQQHACMNLDPPQLWQLVRLDLRS